MSSIMQEWKIEPASPLLDTERDAWLFFEDDVDNIQDVDQSEDLHLTRSEVAQQLLQDIDDIVKEEAEPFNDWFEEKMDLEMFECITPVVEDDITAIKQQQQQQQTIMSSAEPQQHLTYEFELTPPQSPPNSLPSTVTYDLFTQLVNVKPLQEQPQYTFHYVPEQQQQPQPQPTFITLVSSTEAGMSAPPTPIPDLARELAVVDELVRTRAEDLDSNWDHDQWESETTMSSSCSSSSPRGDTTTSGTEEDEEEEEDGDPEWVPSSGTTTSNNTNSKPNRRVKPYVRSSNPEDKKLRKKEQNKTAATRYRQKKKAEVSEILEEERVLQDRNEQLKSDMEDVTREIKYLKSLMREILIAKNKS